MRRDPEPGTSLHRAPQRSVRQQKSRGTGTAKGLGFSQRSDTHHDWTSSTGLPRVPWPHNGASQPVAGFSFPSPNQGPHFWINTVNKTPVGKTKSTHKKMPCCRNTRGGSMMIFYMGFCHFYGNNETRGNQRDLLGARASVA